MPSATIQGKNCSSAWKLTFWIAIVSGFACFFAGGGGSVAGGAVAVALNPFVWLWLFAFLTGRTNGFFCPHCGAVWDRTTAFTKSPAGAECQCRCGHAFLKPAIGS
jgi:hypothetical protein